MSQIGLRVSEVFDRDNNQNSEGAARWAAFWRSHPVSCYFLVILNRAFVSLSAPASRPHHSDSRQSRFSSVVSHDSSLTTTFVIDLGIFGEIEPLPEFP
jgi:hypothetical protein